MNNTKVKIKNDLWRWNYIVPFVKRYFRFHSKQQIFKEKNQHKFSEFLISLDSYKWAKDPLVFLFTEDRKGKSSRKVKADL